MAAAHLPTFFFVGICFGIYSLGYYCLGFIYVIMLDDVLYVLKQKVMALLKNKK